MEQISLSKKILIGVCILGAIATVSLSASLFETNNAGFVQVKQSAGSGDMSVRIEPGVYPQLFGTITPYKISDIYDFDTTQEAISVRFQDSATAQIKGQIKYRLPVDAKSILQIHQDFRSDDAVTAQLIRQVVASAIKQTATLFNAEEVYSTKRSDFIQLINEQIKKGIYATTYSEKLALDENGQKFIDRIVVPKIDATGNPVISEVSAFKRYNVELVQLTINDVDFDDKTTELIAKRKEAEQEQVVAKATAERAKQDTITTQEQGKAKVAEAEAKALVVKKTAVIEAEKAKEDGNEKEAQSIIDQAATLKIIPTETPIAISPKIDGLGSRRVWKAKVIDESLVPTVFEGITIKIIDQTVLNKIARDLKGKANIPGVVFYDE